MPLASAIEDKKTAAEKVNKKPASRLNPTGLGVSGSKTVNKKTAAKDQEAEEEEAEEDAEEEEAEEEEAEPELEVDFDDKAPSKPSAAKAKAAPKASAADAAPKAAPKQAPAVSNIISYTELRKTFHGSEAQWQASKERQEAIANMSASEVAKRRFQVHRPDLFKLGYLPGQYVKL